MLESLAKLSNILGYIQNFNQRDKIQRRPPCLLLQIFLNIFKMLFPKGIKYIPKWFWNISTELHIQNLYSWIAGELR